MRALVPDLDTPGVTEVRPGTYVFNDANTVCRWSASLESCAAFVLTTVVSRPAPDRAVAGRGKRT
jgi:D-serine deaminase-like pyridoxal phosphate-dependent protein